MSQGEDDCVREWPKSKMSQRSLPLLVGLAALLSATSGPLASPARAQDNSCNYALDGQCDEPNYCASGTDSWDCRQTGDFGPNDCFWAYDGRCNEPDSATTAAICPPESDGFDCRGVGQMPQDDSCIWANDGECDHPVEGTGNCTNGTDVTDCRSTARQRVVPQPVQPRQPASLGGSPSSRSGGGRDRCFLGGNDRCDEARYGGTGLCPAGSDTDDCAALASGGTNACSRAHDNQCDEPGIGTGRCPDGTDRDDCSQLSHLRGRNNSCPQAFNNRCDEGGRGTGQCPTRTDTADCLGRSTSAGVRDHFFGWDDRAAADTQRRPWSAIGLLLMQGGGSCTGAMVGPRIGITAAHCFYSNGRTNDAVEFIAGLRNNQYVARSAVVDRFVPESYVQAEQTGRGSPVRYDWAFFVLEDPIGQRTGTFRVHPMTASELRQVTHGGLRVTQAGYSWDAPYRLTAHVGCSLVDAYEDGTVLHQCDATLGDSGSPIFLQRGGRYEVVAMVSGLLFRPSERSLYLAVGSRAFAEQLAEFERTVR